MSGSIEISKVGAVATVRFARPEKKNAITGDMYASLHAFLCDVEADPSVRVAVIAGSDGCFTAGNDLADFLEMTDPTDTRSPFPFLDVLAGFSKPLLAAVDGLALGIGSTLLLHCDAVYVSPTARFQFPFVNLGVVPEAGSSMLLPRLVGPLAASELLLFGEVFDAQRAASLGMVTEIVEAERLDGHVAERAAFLAEKPAASMRLTKKLLKHDLPALKKQMAVEGEHFLERLKSPELAEFVAAFMEKRKPDFSRFN